MDAAGAAGDASPDGLTLAAINGTIVAIVVAAATAYLFLHLQTLEAMKTDLIDKASQINHLDYGMFYTGGPLLRGRDLSLDERTYLLESLAWRGEILTNRAEKLLGVKEIDRSERASVVVELMSQIARSHPFPTIPNGQVGGAVPIRFDSEEDVRKWLPDLQMARDRLIPVVFSPESYALRELMESWESNVPLARLQSSSYERFAAFTRDVDRVYSTVQESASRIDRYRRRLPSRQGFGLAAAAVIGVFVCGVAWPMIDPGVSCVVTAWIPAATYLAGLVTATLWGYRVLR